MSIALRKFQLYLFHFLHSQQIGSLRASSQLVSLWGAL